MQRALAVAVLALSLAGCFVELLPAPASSTVAFICDVLDHGDADRVAIQSWVGDGVTLDRSLAVSALRSEIATLSGRDPSQIKAVERTGPAVPGAGWNDSTVQAWGLTDPFLSRGTVALRVLWVASLGDGNQTGSAPAAGTIALSQAAILAGAERLGTTPAVVARVALLHFAGHALGVVNQGVPVQDPDIQEREGPPTHDPDPTSVLHVGWEDARTMSWAANATYDRYTDALYADWGAATRPGGACL